MRRRLLAALSLVAAVAVGLALPHPQPDPEPTAGAAVTSVAADWTNPAWGRWVPWGRYWS